MLFSAIVGSNLPVMAQNPILESYRWKNRLLLVFVPQVQDQRLTSIKQTLQGVECEFEDRDLLLGVLTRNAPSRIGNDLISSFDEAVL